MNGRKTKRTENWKRVETKVAFELSKYFETVGMGKVKRIPILGRDGPDISVNESDLVIDVKHRQSNPKYLKITRKEIMRIGNYLLAVRIKDLALLAETNKKPATTVKGSRIVKGYLDHMKNHTRRLPNGEIPCVVLHYPNQKISDSILIIFNEDRSKLYERISTSKKLRGSSGKQDPGGTGPTARNGSSKSGTSA
jgi:hypothetical protein